MERQPEGVTRAPEETVTQAQALLDAGRPFHAHEVFEDAWKSGPDDERDLWKGLAQLAVGLTHSARGNLTGGARLLLRGAGAIEAGKESGKKSGKRGERPYGIDVDGLVRWARQLAESLEADGPTVDAAEHAPRLRGDGDHGGGEAGSHGAGGAGDHDAGGHSGGGADRA